MMKAEEFRASYFQETAKRGCTRSCWDASSGSKQQPAVVRKIAMSDEWIQIDKINHVLLLRLGTKMPYPSSIWSESWTSWTRMVWYQQWPILCIYWCVMTRISSWLGGPRKRRAFWASPQSRGGSTTWCTAIDNLFDQKWNSSMGKRGNQCIQNDGCLWIWFHRQK